MGDRPAGRHHKLKAPAGVDSSEGALDRLSEAGRWLSEAGWDLETAKGLLELGRYNAAAFYA